MAAKKHRNGGEPLTTLCPIWPGRESYPQTYRTISDISTITISGRLIQVSSAIPSFVKLRDFSAEQIRLALEQENGQGRTKTLEPGGKFFRVSCFSAHLILTRHSLHASA